VHPVSCRLSILCLALGLESCSTPAPPVSPETTPRPNLLFVLADDHSVEAVSCYGGRLAGLARTPHLDALAAEGMRFEDALCSNSICVPSRASLLTGQYSHVNGVTSLPHALDPEVRHVGHALQAAGYVTALIGKWHLKSEPAGFDHWEILPGQGRYHDPVFLRKGVAGRTTYPGFSTDVVTDLALDWLEERDRTKPFCLFTQFKNCHEPWDHAARHAGLYADGDVPEPASIAEDQSHRSPGSRGYGFTLDTMAGRFEAPDCPTGRLETEGLSSGERRSATHAKLVQIYLRCVAAIDENVGRLVAALRAQGVLDDTVVVYTSDQGYFLGEHGYIDKRWMYEESLRVPLLVRYPREVVPGSVSDELVVDVDLPATLLDFAGVPLPASMQGASLRPLLAGHVPADWRTAAYYHYWAHGTRPAHYGVRTKRHKLIFFHGTPVAGRAEAGAEPTRTGWELYDLERDPYELENCVGDPSKTAVVHELVRELDRLKAELGDDDADHPAIAAARAATPLPGAR